MPPQPDPVANGSEEAGEALSGAFFHGAHYTKHANQVTSE
jgi:hypothetical protein